MAQINLGSRTPPQVRAALKRRKKHQEARGTEFRIKQPRQIEPRGVERRAMKEYRRRFAILTELIREQLVSQLLRLLEDDASDQPNVPKPKTRKREKVTDALGGDLAVILNGIKVEFARRLTEAELAAAAERLGIAVTQHNLKQLGKSLKTVLDVDVFGGEDFLRTQVENYVEQNVSLIKSVDARYFTEIEEIVFRGARQGLSTQEISAKIRERGNVAKRRADLIARDQVNKFNGQLSKLRQTDLGVGRYVWRTSLDERVRPEHRAREGRIFSWDDPPFDGAPGEPINCRCYAEPVLEDLIEE